jgi:hypothetical protein
LLGLNVHTCIGLDLKGLVDAAENYHGVLAENQKLFNEVQELKGNSRSVHSSRTFYDYNKSLILMLLIR